MAEIPSIRTYAGDGQCECCESDVPESEPALYKFQGQILCGDCLIRAIRVNDISEAAAAGGGEVERDEEGGDLDGVDDDDGDGDGDDRMDRIDANAHDILMLILEGRYNPSASPGNVILNFFVHPQQSAYREAVAMEDARQEIINNDGKIPEAWTPPIDA